MRAAVEEAAGGFLAHLGKVVARREPKGRFAGGCYPATCDDSSARIDWQPLAPLFEQKRDAGGGALVAQRARPIRIHRPRAMPAFAADDHPVDPVGIRKLEIDAIEVDRTEQRLHREEPDARRHIEQLRDVAGRPRPD